MHYLLIHEASLVEMLMAEVDSLMEGMAEEVYAMQMPKERHPVETETAANTCSCTFIKYFFVQILFIHYYEDICC